MLKRTPALMSGSALMGLCTSLLITAAASAQDVRSDALQSNGRIGEGGVAGAPGCPGDSLFGQSPSTPDDGWIFGVADSDWDAGGDGLQRWEDFSGVNGPICGMTFWGLRAWFDGGGFVGCDENPMQFAISFHPDEGGLPGAAACSYDVSITGTPTGQIFVGFEMYEYTVDFGGDCCVMQNGWVSITGGGDDAQCWFLWASSGNQGDPGASSLADLNDGGGIATEDFNLAVCLQGEAIPGACCFADGTCLDNVDGAECNACGDVFTSGATCADVDCGPYIAACCLPDDTCIMTGPADCEGQGGQTFCNGQTCNDVNCAEPACGEPGTGDCFVANGTPFCDDLGCCETVCAQDPFCCDTEWDQICADAALALCGGACCFSDGTCTMGTAADCDAAGGKYEGDGTNCLDANCAGNPAGACCFADGSCQDLTADQCAAAGGGYQGDGTDCASTECQGGCGDKTAGSCFEPNGTPFCDDEGCCKIVCAQDPFCCDTEWDGICADAALTLCGGACCFDDGSCTIGSAADCDANGGDYQGDGTNCLDANCAGDLPGACCFGDGSCQMLTAPQCDAAGGAFQGDKSNCDTADCQGGCGDKTAGSCFEPNGTPFCDDEACCLKVCALDPFCCDTEWDGICADAALDICNQGPVGACCVGGGCTEVSGDDCEAMGGDYQGDGTTCADADCPDKCQGDFDGDGDVGILDLLYLLGVWGDCPETDCDTNVCGGYTFECDPSGLCICAPTFDGGSICLDGSTNCGDPCAQDGSCPPGMVCLLDTCCGATTCVPPNECAGEAAPPANATRTITGVYGENYVYEGGLRVDLSNGFDTAEADDNPNCPGDLDGDGTVGMLDLAKLLGIWGPCDDGGGGGDCDAPFECGGSITFCDDGVCICFQGDGGPVCLQDTSCTSPACPNGDADCPPGMGCIVASCCAGPVCAPTCGGAAQAEPEFGEQRSLGVYGVDFIIENGEYVLLD